MPRLWLAAFPLCWLAQLAPAHAVVQGKASSNPYAVRLAGGNTCSGAAIGRQLVVTAAHCARVPVYAGGRSYATASIVRRAQLDDGRTVSVAGDAVILKLRQPLPFSVGVAPVGDGAGDSYTIAGYGTTDERWRGMSGMLHEASLVAAGPRALVDPRRSGAVSASACFGDSGGPVMRGGVLVGVITRAAHPSPHIACGHLTRWAPVVVHGSAAATEVAENPALDAPPPQRRRQARARTDAAVSEVSLFSWFAKPGPKPRKSLKNKRASR